MLTKVLLFVDVVTLPPPDPLRPTYYCSGLATHCVHTIFFLPSEGTVV